MKRARVITYAGPVTPGPWKYALAFENNAPNYYAITTGKWGAPTIAKCYGTEGEAQLMTAAPDMLAALRAVNDAYSFISETAPTPLQHAMRKARAAIAKATS